MTGPVHYEMEATSRENTNLKYYRLGGGEQLGEVALDEWKSHKFTKLTGKAHSEPGQKTLEKITAATSHYLKDPGIQQVLKELAENLVERRRLRARDASEWDRYASFSFYKCEAKHCNTRWNTADGFRTHLKQDHPYKVEHQALDGYITEMRRHFWVYR